MQSTSRVFCNGLFYYDYFFKLNNLWFANYYNTNSNTVFWTCHLTDNVSRSAHLMTYSNYRIIQNEKCLYILCMHLCLFLTQPFVFQLHNIGSKDAHVIPIGKTLEVWVLISNTNRSGGSSVGSNKVTLWTGVWLYGHMVMMVYTDCASRQPQFHMAPAMSTTKQCFNHFGDYSKCCVKLCWVTHSELHITRAQWVCSETENSTLVAIVKHIGLISRWGTQQVFIYVHVYKVQYWQTKVGHRHPKIICHQIVKNPHFSWDKSFFNFLLVWLKYFASFFHNMKEYQHSCIS